MNIREINDDNSLVEVYLHWLIENTHELDKVGHIKEYEGLGIYYVWHKDTERYCIISTDVDAYNDKRIKKPLTRYTKSTTMFYPTEEEWSKLTEESYGETLRFMGEGDRESKIIFTETQGFSTIQKVLNGKYKRII